MGSAKKTTVVRCRCGTELTRVDAPQEVTRAVDSETTRRVKCGQCGHETTIRTRRMSASVSTR